MRRFKPYPSYKDSGVEWLGEIPAHWEIDAAEARRRLASTGSIAFKPDESEASTGDLISESRHQNGVD